MRAFPHGGAQGPRGWCGAGLSTADSARIQAPIGLNLDSKTSAEIALVMLADIVRVRHGIAREQL